MVRVRPVEPGPEPLRLAQERELRRGQRILEDKVRMPEHSRLVLSEHRLVYKRGHTPRGHNMKEPLVHTLEHTSRREQHSLVWRYSTLQPERRTMVSSSTGQVSGA